MSNETKLQRRHYSAPQKAGILREHFLEKVPVSTLCDKHSLNPTMYYQWQRRYGKVNEHNAWVPRDHWLEAWEKQAIISYQQAHPLEGYRRLTYMMMDADMVAVSPSSVYRVLKAAGLLAKWNGKPSKKGTGFIQPLKPHEHWHIDISYLNICGTFYYLCSILDGFSRYLVHWEIREAMTEGDVATILQRAKELFPDARRIVATFVADYNTRRLHSAIQYVTPADKLADRAQAILAARDAKLEAARKVRQTRRQEKRHVA